MEWNEMQEKYKEIKGCKFVIKNTNTGKYVCDEKGETKVFSDVNEAKLYIRVHHLTSIFEICDMTD